MRLLVMIPCWKRSRITAQVLRSFSNQKTDIEFQVMCCGSRKDPEIRLLRGNAESYGALWIERQNKPLASKIQLMFEHAQTLEWDYVMIIGSDDVVSDNFLRTYEWPMSLNIDAWGWGDCYFYGDKRLYHWRGYDPEKRFESIGAGRIFSRRLCEEVGWKFYENTSINSGLDGQMTRTLNKSGFFIPFANMPRDVYMIDVKSDVNVSPLSTMLGTKRAFEVEVPESMRGYLP